MNNAGNYGPRELVLDLACLAGVTCVLAAGWP